MNERDRLVKIMECEGLNAKQFSQEVGVSPGTISNIVGGRNKPSLEVVQAILRRFRAISCLWLVTGTGSMYLNSPVDDVPRLPFPDDKTGEDTTNTSTAISAIPASSLATMEKRSNRNVQSNANTATEPTLATSRRTVTKVMIFYSDGTFEER